MDWYVDARSAVAVRELRREVGRFLRRHADESSDVEAADLVVSELLSNVHQHARGDAWVTVDWSGRTAQLTVRDVGEGFELDVVPRPPDAPSGRGLAITSSLVPDLTAQRRAVGSSVTAQLPVRRADPVDHDPTPHRVSRLPPLSAATPDGFGRETFLLALAVQLAMTAEETHGPDAAEALVAQVGADVGAQMESEFRAAFDIDGQLSAAEVATCLVRLKDAIGGGFRVLEVDDTRIVLGNTRCPFGSLVRQAPSLCRMTSSVFGSIAASGTGRDVTVDLQERIAIGDETCRVVIELRPQADTIGHRYRSRDVPRRSPGSGS